jgi:putative tryptophan/tyrosine transport system substrate-binding protein
VTGADPVKTGLVDSFSRPGGNLTGVFVLLSALGIKRLDLLRELVPSTGTFALLANPKNPNLVDVPEIEAAANALGRRLEVLPAPKAILRRPLQPWSNIVSTASL